MTNNDYKIQVEKEHGKILKEIMYFESSPKYRHITSYSNSGS